MTTEREDPIEAQLQDRLCKAVLIDSFAGKLACECAALRRLCRSAMDEIRMEPDEPELVALMHKLKAAQDGEVLSE